MKVERVTTVGRGIDGARSGQTITRCPKCKYPLYRHWVRCPQCNVVLDWIDGMIFKEMLSAKLIDARTGRTVMDLNPCGINSYSEVYRSGL